MALPKVEVPTYELEVPSTDEKLKFRPFLVKEEKILLMALESKDNGEMTNAAQPSKEHPCNAVERYPPAPNCIQLDQVYRLRAPKVPI